MELLRKRKLDSDGLQCTLLHPVQMSSMVKHCLLAAYLGGVYAMHASEAGWEIFVVSLGRGGTFCSSQAESQAQDTHHTHTSSGLAFCSPPQLSALSPPPPGISLPLLSPWCVSLCDCLHMALAWQAAPRWPSLHPDLVLWVCHQGVCQLSADSWRYPLSM